MNSSTLLVFYTFIYLGHRINWNEHLLRTCFCGFEVILPEPLETGLKERVSSHSVSSETGHRVLAFAVLLFTKWSWSKCVRMVVHTHTHTHTHTHSLSLLSRTSASLPPWHLASPAQRLSANGVIRCCSGH